MRCRWSMVSKKEKNKKKDEGGFSNGRFDRKRKVGKVLFAIYDTLETYHPYELILEETRYTVGVTR
ncbi:hypothetical protein [Sinobaca qinghaiensis]|uniref:hypothetical protein n=1 Tax=Sinobaca qinghaiensis TaxID=342944 RepID=UPI001473AF02|nr:hypothetical protein [Sinobaca qinghaiensis]